MNNNLKISIVGTLNTGKSLGEINAAISGLEKKVKSLKLKVEINDNILSTLNNFNKQMSKMAEIAKNTGKVIEESINPDGSKTKRTYFNGMKGEFSDVTKAAKESANQQIQSLEQVSKELDKVTKQVERYNAENKKIGGKTSLSNLDGTIKRTVTTDSNNNVTGHIVTHTIMLRKQKLLNKQQIKKNN
jgi:uncharacterized coiled-coil DUF342 family protein